MSRLEILKKHYEPRIEKYSETSAVLDWESRDAQYKRFRAMTDNTEIDGRSLLDIGCGCGDLYGLIVEEKLEVDYTGVDILEKMIERASVEYPGGRFRTADIFSPGFKAADVLGSDSFDITYTSGIFNLNAGNNEAFLKKAIPVIAALSAEAFVFNLLDPSSPDRDDAYFYYAPDRAAALAEPFSTEISLIKGYLSNDYTLICKK